MKNLVASVRQRLLNVAKARGEEFQLVLTRFALERLLYRLSISTHNEDFVLKGAMLFTLWTGEPHRATKDLDLLGRGNPGATRLEGVFRALCRVEAQLDGLDFVETSVEGATIREEEEYLGVRVQLEARLGVARIPLQVDVGFGDVVKPGPEDVVYPSILDLPAPRLKAYTKETMIAEKLHAMVTRGITNSRMKDFYDIWSLSRIFPFEGERVREAIQAAFQRRGTALPEGEPLALTQAFAQDPSKRAQWTAFTRRGQLRGGHITLEAIVEATRQFLLPPLVALASRRKFELHWQPDGPWIPS